MSVHARRLWLLPLLALAACGSSGREAPKRFDPFTQVRDRSVQRDGHASPRWERLATLTGSGSGSRAFTVARGAIQWRAHWRCDSGRLRLAARRRLADAACPRRGVASDVVGGEQTLRVEASGRWRVVLEQQVDTPLREPPLAAMRAPGVRRLAAGRFYRVERRGRGRASLYRLRGGRLALRLDGFSTSANSDLFVWLSAAVRPRTTVAAAHSRHRVLAALKSTVGEQNYLLPRGWRPRDIRSVVVWCAPVRIAYTAAGLEPSTPPARRGRG